MENGNVKCNDEGKNRACTLKNKLQQYHLKWEKTLSRKCKARAPHVFLKKNMMKQLCDWHTNTVVHSLIFWYIRRADSNAVVHRVHLHNQKRSSTTEICRRPFSNKTETQFETDHTSLATKKFIFSQLCWKRKDLEIHFHYTVFDLSW